ncbi:MAG: SUF system NifU family Fe-S cluster assembly protein [candidate division KSB1 bacterium]|nr:SUF system NifU family Fe-S cluster assembly protein [candidate division KSB1 bacterium]
MNIESLYHEIILDHYKHPRNKGRLPDADLHREGFNPLCGDRIELYLRVVGEKILLARFDGAGCSISQASASMLTEAVKGKSLDELRDLIQAVTRMLRGETDGSDSKLGDLEALQGVSQFPVRVKCALLPWKLLEEILQDRKGSVSPSVPAAEG